MDEYNGRSAKYWHDQGVDAYQKYIDEQAKVKYLQIALREQIEKSNHLQQQIDEMREQIETLSNQRDPMSASQEPTQEKSRDKIHPAKSEMSNFAAKTLTVVIAAAVSFCALYCYIVRTEKTPRPNHISATGQSDFVGPTEMEVSATVISTDPNNVGNNWVVTYSIDGGNHFMKNEKCTVTLIPTDTMRYTITATEKDDSPDTGLGAGTVVISEENLRDGFFLDQTVKVTENEGTYKGHVASLYVRLTFSPVK